MLQLGIAYLACHKSGKRRKVSSLRHVSNCEYRMQVQEQGDQKMVSPSGDRGSINNIEAGNISNENAERRANTPVNEQPFTSIQAFDGVGEHLAIPVCLVDAS